MKWLHNLLKGASLTSALFIFQACYGTPQDALYQYGEAPLDFDVKSAETGKGLQDILILGRVTENDSTWTELGATDANGHVSVCVPYVNNMPGPVVRFEDAAGVYVAKDTTFADLRQRDIPITLTKK